MERNVDSNLSNGDPYVYIHAAKVPAGAGAPSLGGTAAPVVVTAGQQNSSTAGGAKSLDGTAISGYSRGPGNDFPRNGGILMPPRREPARSEPYMEEATCRAGTSPPPS
ncbi:hypothetical protein ACIA5C_10210 [Actinoplanes sp. NPDC051343]|uniref:hypothetical protein n=1 Tax=Actinoplanes sp. NPDC051343 TaxID=3363906 RepID=UPI0037AFC06C